MNKNQSNNIYDLKMNILVAQSILITAILVALQYEVRRLFQLSILGFALGQGQTRQWEIPN